MTLIRVKLFGDLLFFGGHLLPESQLSYLNNEGGSDGKESACKVGDLDLIPGSGRSPREGNGNPLQHSCLENSMDREAWQATVQRVRHNGSDLVHTQLIYIQLIHSTV